MSDSEDDFVIRMDFRIPKALLKFFAPRHTFTVDFPADDANVTLDGTKMIGPYGSDADEYDTIYGNIVSTCGDTSDVPDGGTSTTPRPGGGWTLPPISVPNCTANGKPDAGAYNCLLIWKKRRATGDISGPDVSGFYGKCAGSSSSASLARDLSNAPYLHVVIPDGANHGTYVATRVAAMRWNVIIRGTNFVLAGSDATAKWTLRGPHASVASTSIASNPFVAIFPGEHFGATHDIVVTLA